MGWYVPFNRLDIKQVEVLNGITRSLDRPHWVQGFAGTGKTIILTHAIERVAAEHPRASLCYITFTHALKDMVASGLHGPVAQRIVIKTHSKFLSDNQHCDYVFLDEVQDIQPSDLARIRTLAGSVIAAGDPEQRIYAGSATKEQIQSTLEPQVWLLVNIFRLTSLLRRIAQAIFPSTKIVEGQISNTTADVTIRMGAFDNPASEVRWVWEEALSRARPDTPSVILFPRHDAITQFAGLLAKHLGTGTPPRALQQKDKPRDYEPFNQHWADKGIALQYLGNGQGSLDQSETRPMVYLMTFQSSKGLDFENVFIPGMHYFVKMVNAHTLERDPELERRLLFVAVTRSRKNLFITYHGKGPHRLLANLPSEAMVPMKTAARLKDEEDFF